MPIIYIYYNYDTGNNIVVILNQPLKSGHFLILDNGH